MSEGSPDELRASDADRERVAAMLRQHCTEGRITLDELAERLGDAYAARTHRELYAVTRDLPVPAVRQHPAERPAPAPVGGLRGLRAALSGWAFVAVILVAIWALAGFGYFWPAWPLGIWGALIVAGYVRRWMEG